MTLERVRTSAARRASRSTFAAAAAVALYTAAVFGAVLYAGLTAPLACLAAAACGVAIAAVAARVVYRSEERERARRIAAAQLESVRAAAPAPARPASVPAGPATLPEQPRLKPALQREMRESREIQSALLPDAVPFVEGYHLEVDYLPCGALGGDFYDFQEFDEERLLLTLGDVSGKGPAGAIVMAMVQTLFREHAASAAGPADLLRRVNEGFAGALGKGVFVTALAALLDAGRNRLTLAGAGHHPVLLLNPEKRRSTRVGARGLALGLVRGQEFAHSLVETSVDLDPGDSLLLFTDGATDSVEDLARDVGEGRFLAAAASAVLTGPHGALKRLREDLWSGGGRRDDTTLLMVSRLRSAARTRMPSDRKSTDVRV